MSTTTTQYIVWNNRDNRREAGPFETTGEADTAMRRVYVRRGPDASLVLTRESVTAVKQK